MSLVEFGTKNCAQRPAVSLSHSPLWLWCFYCVFLTCAILYALFVVGWTSRLGEEGLWSRAGPLWLDRDGRHMLAFTLGRLPTHAWYLLLDVFETGRLLVYLAAFHLIPAYFCNPPPPHTHTPYPPYPPLTVMCA